MRLARRRRRATTPRLPVTARRKGRRRRPLGASFAANLYGRSFERMNPLSDAEVRAARRLAAFALQDSRRDRNGLRKFHAGRASGVLATIWRFSKSRRASERARRSERRVVERNPIWRREPGGEWEAWGSVAPHRAAQQIEKLRAEFGGEYEYRGPEPSDWVAEMAELRKPGMKPRPIEKLYGARGPTPEQAAAWKAEMAAWNKQYRHASQQAKMKNPLDWATFVTGLVSGAGAFAATKALEHASKGGRKYRRRGRIAHGKRRM